MTVMTHKPIPELPHGCWSWVVVNRSTGIAMFETFNRGTVERVNTNAYEILTALDWLVRVNQRAA